MESVPQCRLRSHCMSCKNTSDQSTPSILSRPTTELNINAEPCYPACQYPDSFSHRIKVLDRDYTVGGIGKVKLLVKNLAQELIRFESSLHKAPILRLCCREIARFSMNTKAFYPPSRSPLCDLLAGCARRSGDTFASALGYAQSIAALSRGTFTMRRVICQLCTNPTTRSSVEDGLLHRWRYPHVGLLDGLEGSNNLYNASLGVAIGQHAFFGGFRYLGSLKYTP